MHASQEVSSLGRANHSPCTYQPLPRACMPARALMRQHQACGRD